MMAIPVAEPRAAAPPAPSTAPAPAATRGAASPPVTPGKDEQSGVRADKQLPSEDNNSTTPKMGLSSSAPDTLWWLITVWLKHALKSDSTWSKCQPKVSFKVRGMITNHCSTADCRQSDEQVATQLPPSFLPPTARRLFSGGPQSSSVLASLSFEHKKVKWVSWYV